jgi:hypothetical protein
MYDGGDSVADAEGNETGCEGVHPNRYESYCRRSALACAFLICTASNARSHVGSPPPRIVLAKCEILPRHGHIMVRGKHAVALVALGYDLASYLL